MHKKIEKHIVDVFSAHEVEEEFKLEIIDACIEEYNKLISQGNFKEVSYDKAIEDFDKEYKNEKYYLNKKSKVKKKIGILSILISIILILFYTLLVQFLPQELFTSAITVVLIPNIIFLLIKSLYILIKKYNSLFCEISYSILSLMLYTPFIFIEIIGGDFNIINYILTSCIYISIALVVIMIKNKKFSFNLTIASLILTIIFISFMNYAIYATALTTLLYFLLNALVFTLLVFNISKLNKNKNMFYAAIGALVIILLCMIIKEYVLNLYLTLTFLMILATFAKMNEKSKQIWLYFCYYNILIITFLNLYFNTVILIKFKNNISILNDDLLLILMFIILVFLEKYLHNNKKV